MILRNSKDFEIPVADNLLQDPDALTVDEATEIIFTEKDWPLLGGPSGAGWSYWSVAQRCARLFQASYDQGARDEKVRQAILGGVVPAPLQIGALYHTLEALYYAAEFPGGECLVAADRGGLCAVEAAGAGRRKLWAAPPDAVGQFLTALKEMCGYIDGIWIKEKARDRAPDLAIILEAERLFGAHTDYWGRNEDLYPLAIEWFAGDPRLGYTCRYDAIMRVGENDPIMGATPGVYIFERKTAKWIDEIFLEGWTMDGEVLGQLMLWESSGCAQRFGALTGIVIDIVSKSKAPQLKRLILGPDLPPVANHARWIEHTKAMISLWRSTQSYPQSFANCHGRYGRCALFNDCAMGLTP